MANQHTSEELFTKKHTGDDSPLSPTCGDGTSSKASTEEQEDITKGYEYFDMASAGVSCETNQNAEPFFVTEVKNLHSVCLYIMQHAC